MRPVQHMCYYGGGLVVMKGSSKLFDKLFDENSVEDPGEQLR